MLLPRLLTAALGIPLLLYAIHLGGFAYLALVVLLAGLACREYALVLWLGGRHIRPAVCALGGSLLALAVGLCGPSLPAAAASGLGLAQSALTLWLLACVLAETLRREHSFDRLAASVLGPLLIGWTLGHLVLLRESAPFGRELSFLLFFSVWTMDSAAYAAGTALGKRPLAPVLSPKKTWEGAAAGAAGAFAAVLLARLLLLREAVDVSQALLLALLVAVLGQLSDLAQSLVKRAAGVKDSAGLLPGHGGVFDRFDSLLLLAPAAYYWSALCLPR